MENKSITELLDNLRPVSPKPGHLERVKTPVGRASVTGDDEEQQPCKERFLRINVRHITDGQVSEYSIPTAKLKRLIDVIKNYFF